jgi:hypothetical protein
MFDEHFRYFVYDQKSSLFDERQSILKKMNANAMERERTPWCVVATYSRHCTIKWRTCSAPLSFLTTQKKYGVCIFTPKTNASIFAVSIPSQHEQSNSKVHFTGPPRHSSEATTATLAACTQPPVQTAYHRQPRLSSPRAVCYRPRYIYTDTIGISSAPLARSLALSHLHFKAN